MRGADFIKMHGLGNDFVVLDARAHALALDDARGARHRRPARGVGCDQLIVIEPPRDAARRRSSCASATPMAARSRPAATPRAASPRCCMRETRRDARRDRDRARACSRREARGDGARHASIWGRRGSTGATSRWRATCDTLHVPLALGPLGDPVCTSMGNPHATFFVADAEAIDLADARAAARARSALSRARQYRRRAGAGARDGCGCACGSAAPASRWPAAPAPAPRWSPPRAAA